MRRVLAAFAVSFTLGACKWTPTARDVQPEQLLAGPARVLALLDSQGNYALFTSGTGDAMRYRILTASSRQSCALMANDVPVVDTLTAPNLKGDNVPKFWLAVQRNDPSGGPTTLYYSDEKCNYIGPFGSLNASAGVTKIALKDDSRNVSLVMGPDDTLILVDPWTKQTRTIASHVSQDGQNHYQYQQVSQSDSSTAPQALWINEGGKLTQRGLDGTLLLELGNDVTEYQQALLQGVLRVAYADGGNVYEAKGPLFSPVLVSNDACNPSYGGTSLNLHTPCADQQLVRIDLLTGMIKRFTAGVYNAYTVGDINLEDQADANGNVTVWVASSTTRTQLMPTPYEQGLSSLDRNRLVGLTKDGTFGMWNLTSGWTPAFPGVSSIQAFRDSRTSRLLWLMQYRVVDELGPLVGFDQSELERTVAGTDITGPTVLSASVIKDAYQVFLPSILPEPMILSLEPAAGSLDGGVQLKGSDGKYEGVLHARLLSGSLASEIDSEVSSFQVALAPYPGILYGILDGPRSGLWFAAL